MPSRKDCIEDILKRAGGKRSRKDVEDLLNDIDERAQSYQEDGSTSDQAYGRAREEMLEEQAETQALRKRAEIMDARKAIGRGRYYKTAQEAISKFSPKLAAQATRLALEAKLVGVNLPFFKNQMSVDAQYTALRRLWVGGFARDLEKSGVLELFASRSLEPEWTRELHELNYRSGPDVNDQANVGVTKNADALKIAQAIHKWQRTSINTMNREGAWIRSYSGYVTRTSHDADAIRRVGPEKWVSDTIGKLDLLRTFGTKDRQRALDALYQMWTPLKDGDHFDYSKVFEEPIYPNVSGKASANRELHFKTSEDWRAYNEQYGVSTPTETVVRSFETNARRTALIREFGSKPKEAYDEDKRSLLSSLQQESQGLTKKLAELQKQSEAQPSPEGAEKIASSIVEARQQAAISSGKFEDFKSWQQALDNRFAQIDGSSMKPVNRTMSEAVSNWMALQRMAKLGNVALTHFASLPTKVMETRFWNIPFADRYAGLIRGLTQGAEGSAKREAMDATLVAFENRLGHMMAMYDVADAPRGFLSKWETLFFKLTGVSSVIDNQKADTEVMFASHIGGKREQDWAGIGPKEQRVLQGFGIGEAEWKALKQVEWSKIGDRTMLFPSDAMKLSDDHVRSYLKDNPQPLTGRKEPNADDIGKGRDDLALMLATAYTDRAGFAIPMPNARTRAIMFGKNFEPGTGINAALRLVYQFKMWPADMITRSWGREIYGTKGDGALDRMAGITEFLVGSIIFGVAAESVREAIKGHNPMAELKENPLGSIVKGAQRSGFGSLAGDFLLGQFDRHGFSASANLVGPTVGQGDTLMDLLHAGGETKQGMFSPSAWRQRGADAIKLAKDNTPFMNLWATSWATDYLVWNRLQEWIRPGYLRRVEDRQHELSGTEHWFKPSTGGLPGAIGRTLSH